MLDGGLTPRPEDGFTVEEFEPAYLRLHREGRLAERAEAALRELEDCRACPRNCGVNRLRNETRVCHTGRYAIVASAFPHFGEEDCLRGWRGSGTIFFSLCNLRCAWPGPATTRSGRARPSSRCNGRWALSRSAPMAWPGGAFSCAIW